MSTSVSKVKATVKVFSNRDDALSMVGAFEEKCLQKGQTPVKKRCNEICMRDGHNSST